MNILKQIFTQMEVIKNIFAIYNSIYDENVECEARIRGYFINAENVNRFISNHNWIFRQYTERKKRSAYNRKCIYRQREGSTICKSLLVEYHIKEIWAKICLSYENPCSVNLRDYLTDSKTEQINRWTLSINDCVIEIGFSEDRYWIEIEKTKLTTPVQMFNTIKWVVLQLQGCSKLIMYQDYYTMKHLISMEFGRFCISKAHYAKPITLSKSTIQDVSRSIYMGPKYDGIRAFCFVRMGLIYSISLTESVWYVGKCSVVTDKITILDCELLDNVYYIIDIPVSEEEYIGDSIHESRMNMRENFVSTNIRIKPWYTFDDPKDVIHQIGQKCDGVIFMRHNYMENIYKYKLNNTVDLLCLNNNLYTCDNVCIDLPVVTKDPLISNVIYEFEYRDNSLHVMRDRPDKKGANSSNIIRENIYNAFTNNPFDGYGAIFMRRYHNRLKSAMLEEYATKKVLLDIGTGQGGDINKWIKLEMPKVYCIEPDLSMIKESIKRGNKNTIINSPIKNCKSIMKKINTRVEAISAFFCMNLFDNADMIGLFKLLSSMEEGCIFMGICLTNITSEKNVCFETKITSRESYKMTIYDTRIVNIKETIIYMDQFDKYMRRIGYIKINGEKLLNDKLSIAESKLSSFYESFVYVKDGVGMDRQTST